MSGSASGVRAGWRRRTRRTRRDETCRYAAGWTTCLSNIYAPLISPYRRRAGAAAFVWFGPAASCRSLAFYPPPPKKKEKHNSDSHKRTGEGGGRATLAAFCTFKSNGATGCTREPHVETRLLTSADNVLVSGLAPAGPHAAG